MKTAVMIMYLVSLILSLVFFLMPRTRFQKEILKAISESVYLKVAVGISVIPLLNSAVAGEGIYYFIRALITDYTGTVDYLKRYMGLRDSYGLKFDLDYLTEVKKTIHKLPLEEQAKFVDAVTIANVDDEAWILGFLDRELYEPGKVGPTIDFTHWNTTAVGCIAFIALHSKFSYARDHAYHLLNKYKEYRESFE